MPARQVLTLLSWAEAKKVVQWKAVRKPAMAITPQERVGNKGPDFLNFNSTNSVRNAIPVRNTTRYGACRLESTPNIEVNPQKIMQRCRRR